MTQAKEENEGMEATPSTHIHLRGNKINEGSELKIITELNSADNESSVISSYAASKTGEQREVYYKLATPCFPPEPDWSITLSRNDFPWYAVKFEDYSAQECFDMYRSLITDEDTFNK